jgi:hypothetical protein
MPKPDIVAREKMRGQGISRLWHLIRVNVPPWKPTVPRAGELLGLLAQHPGRQTEALK